MAVTVGARTVGSGTGFTGFTGLGSVGVAVVSIG